MAGALDPGSDISWTAPGDDLKIAAKAYYMVNVGDKQPKGTARFAEAGAGALPFNIYGAKYNENMANLGLEVEYAPAALDGFKFGLAYDTLLGSEAQNHNISLQVVFKF